MKRLVFTLCTALSALLAGAQESRTAFNFLRLPASAHAAALGGDNVSLIEDDPTLLFHNPALIYNVESRTVNLNYMTYTEGTKDVSAAFVKPAGQRAAWGVGAQLLDYGEMRETTADNRQTGTFRAKDIALSGTFAYGLGTHFTGGITGKFITSYIGSYSSVAMGVDLGLNYYDADTEWSVSAVARNLGGQLSAYDDEFERMPLDLQLGVTKRLIGSPLRLSATLVRLNDWEHGLGKHLVVGADLILSPQFYVAAGYNAMRASEMSISDDDGESAHGAGLSLGAGLQLERFQLQVSYAKYHVSASSLLFNVSFKL